MSMLSYHQARQQILDAVATLPLVTVPLLEAVGRAVGEDIIASRPLPGFDNSAMDGYAVRAEDCSIETVLPVVGYLPAGGRAECQVKAGQTVKIMTGAPIPPGADAVVPFEETEESVQQIRLLGPVKKGAHIRWQGEDIKPGDLVITAGTILRPAEISLLASLGMAQVPVCRQAKVAILSTGDELQEIDETQTEGGVVNSNSWALAAAVRELGGEPIMLGIARDNRESLREKLAAGLLADGLITSAGVSAGDLDLVREVLDELGVKQQFWKINIKPGKPTAFGMKGPVPVFSLPGNPVSALITFEEFVRPALLKMMGHKHPLKPIFKARLQQPISKKAGRLQLLRVLIEMDKEGTLLIASSGDQNTGILKTLIRARGIALLSEDRERYEVGELLDVHLLGSGTVLGS